MNYNDLKAIHIKDEEVSTLFPTWYEPYQGKSMIICLHPETGQLSIDLEEVPRYQKEEYLRRMIELGMTPELQLHSHEAKQQPIPLVDLESTDPFLTHQEDEIMSYLQLRPKNIQIQLTIPDPFVGFMWFVQAGEGLMDHLREDEELMAAVLGDFVQTVRELTSEDVQKSLDRVVKQFNQVNQSSDSKSKDRSFHEAAFLFSAYQKDGEWNWWHNGNGSLFATIQILILLFIVLPFNESFKHQLLTWIETDGLGHILLKRIDEMPLETPQSA